jgi:hypothetical protein
MTIDDNPKVAEFRRRHERFFEAWPRLLATINTAYDRRLKANGTQDPVIFYLGIRMVDDFDAILLLAGNGLALAAQSLLRGMYERLVTAAHLHEHPDEAMTFAEFDIVQRRRAAIAIRDTIGLTPERELKLDELEKEYQRVKDNYIMKCRKCGDPRGGTSWSKLDLVTMAKKQPELSPLLYVGYYLPLLQAHSTLKSISMLLEEEDGALQFRKDYTELSDEIFRLAYLMLLHSLEVQSAHFGEPILEEKLGLALDDYMKIYPPKDRQS